MKKIKANYEKRILNTGEIIEMIGSYEQIDNIVMNPPVMLSTKEQNQIIKIMKKNSMKQLIIII